MIKRSAGKGSASMISHCWLPHQHALRQRRLGLEANLVWPPASRREPRPPPILRAGTKKSMLEQQPTPAHAG